MGKTYSKKQKWTELNIQYGVGRPVFGNYSYRTGEGLNGLSSIYVNEKLTRHPNKKSKKSGLRNELYEVIGPNSSLAKCRNQIGEIWERSSRKRLIRKTENGSRRAKIKADLIKEINEFYYNN